MTRWTAIPDRLPAAFPTDLAIVGTIELRSDTGAIIYALACVRRDPRADALHDPRLERLPTSRYFAVYWERNTAPPEMRALPLIEVAPGLFELEGGGPLSPGAYQPDPLRPPR